MIRRNWVIRAVPAAAHTPAPPQRAGDGGEQERHG
jgi:hypothetical protein